MGDRLKFAVGGIVAALLLGAVCGRACDTPVYRFATYNWQSAPYRVFYVAKGTPLAADDPVRRAISLAAPPVPVAKPDDEHVVTQARANVELVELDAAAAEPLAKFSGALREEAEAALEAFAGKNAATFYVMAPDGTPIYEGPLVAGDIERLVASPVRKNIIDALANGKAGVFVLVEGDDAAANKAASDLIDATIRRAAEGELTPPRPGDDSVNADPAKIEADKKVAMAVVRVRRDDPHEVWLVRALMAVEEDIAERKEAMVFSVYGRGRAMPPAIGTGIDEDELQRQVRFLLGPCACTVKHENPGLDLPLVVDWDAVALAMAKRHGPETGNERLLNEVPGLFPESVPDAKVATETLATPERKTDDVPAGVKGGSADLAALESGKVRAKGSDAWSESTAPSEDTADVDASADSGDGGAMLGRIGVGVAVAAVLLAAASVFLFRRSG